MTSMMDPPPWAGGPGGPTDRPLVQPFITQGGDTLPLIAELWGHPGEWLAIYAGNLDLPDFNNLQPGTALTMPADWVGPATKPAEAAPEPEKLESRAHARTRD